MTLRFRAYIAIGKVTSRATLPGLSKLKEYIREDAAWQLRLFSSGNPCWIDDLDRVRESSCKGFAFEARGNRKVGDAPLLQGLRYSRSRSLPHLWH